MKALQGSDLKQAFSAATRCLERYRDTVNALNVFPVPDGDTGTNMLLTMRAAMDRCAADASATAGGVSAALADGAFWEARGNSGVILSQFLKGFADALKGKEVCHGADLAQAFNMAAEAAYRAVGQPVEGTMLTVIRCAGEAARAGQARGESDATRLWETAYHAAREALDRTPSQLPVLREAGVVDAGGMGVVAIMGGALGHLTGQEETQLDLSAYAGRIEPGPVSAASIDSDYLDAIQEVQWGYCTQFLIEGQGLSPEKIRERLGAETSASAVVVGDDQYVRVHVHALDPGPVLSHGVSLGQLSQIKIENMNRQNQEFVAGHRQALLEEPSSALDASSQDHSQTPAVVAVAPGDGFAGVFREYGCAAVVSGGQTMNPSVRQLLDAVEGVRAGDVILLPNNKNILVAAEQAAAAAGERLHVVPSRTVPQGVAALLAFNPEESLERNLKAMHDALKQVVTIEVTGAVRSTTVGGVKVKAGQYMGLLEGRLTAVGDSPELALQSALAQVGLSEGQVVTLYRGADACREGAEAVCRDLQDQTPGLQVDLVYGGQPHYPYLASVE